MLFEIANPREGRVSHCGVMEFVAEEGVVYLPYWMMQNLLLQEGDLVRFKSASLPKGTYVKLRPQSKDFLDITNPKAVCVAPRRGDAAALLTPRAPPSLETTLRKYSCLTAGDSILISYNNKRFFIDIQEVRPPRAVSIIETDCEVDFAPPLDYVEPQRPPPPAPAPAPPAQLPAEGALRNSVRWVLSDAASAAAGEAQPPKFAAFAGGARRLDGKAVPPPSATAGPSAASAPATAASAPKAVQGKLVFGGAKPAAAASIVPAAPAAPPEPPKFTAFSGTARKLK